MITTSNSPPKGYDDTKVGFLRCGPGHPIVPALSIFAFLRCKVSRTIDDNLAGMATRDHVPVRSPQHEGHNGSWSGSLAKPERWPQHGYD